MLAVGAIAPEIDAVTTKGHPFKLTWRPGDPGSLCTVLYFYPKAFTSGCTLEARLFRDNHVELSLLGARVVGVSTDDNETQCRFAAEIDTPFPLIADHDRSISRAFDVLWPIIGLAKRVTYIIAPDRRILATIRHETNATVHRDAVIRGVNELHQHVSRQADPRTRD